MVETSNISGPVPDKEMVVALVRGELTLLSDGGNLKKWQHSSIKFMDFTLDWVDRRLCEQETLIGLQANLIKSYEANFLAKERIIAQLRAAQPVPAIQLEPDTRPLLVRLIHAICKELIK